MTAAAVIMENEQHRPINHLLPIKTPGQKLRDKLVSRLANDPDFLAVCDAIEAFGQGGTIETTVSEDRRLKRIGVRLQREMGS